MPIPKLLITMSLPMMISMLVQALYNIVDSMFVAKLSENALTAVSLAFPVQNLMNAVAVGTGVGINALLSRNLGEKRFDAANQTAKNGLFLALLSYLAFALFGLFGTRLFFAAQTDNAQILHYGCQYVFIVCALSLGVFTQVTCERLLQSTGKTIYTMFTQGSGAIINIILDPIFIFGLFGFPRLEVAGAALATVTGQFIAAILALFFNVKKNKELNINMKHFRPDKHTIINIYRVGVPSIVMQSIGSIMTFGMNKILLMFSSTATAVFGIYFKLQSFVFMPVFGLNNGLIPIIAYNYGAKNKKRIIQTIKLSTCMAVSIMAVGVIVFQTMTEFMLLHLFNASQQMLSIGVPALRILSLSFILAGFSIIFGSVFQALGNGVYSLIVSVSRQLLTILPLAYIFARVFGLSMVWWAVAIAELVSLSVSSILLRKIYREKIVPLGE